jgi:tetratricopeptide (TPR) repeat protein
LRAQRDARELVHWLQSRPLLIADVVEAIKIDEGLDANVKQRALAFAHLTTDEPDHVNNTSWLLVRSPRCPLHRSIAAAKAMKQITDEKRTVTYLNTYGVALYRAGDYASAIRVLSESDRGSPSDIAFLAMAYFRIGDRAKSSDEMDRLRRTMELLRWSNDLESLNFAREAETLLRPVDQEPPTEGN